jgi:hypothetical protein
MSFMAPLTIYLAKLLGLYCIIVATAMLADRRNTLATVNALVHDAPLMFVVDIITIGLGLAFVLGHNIWTGGVLPVVVTILGWATLLKGLVLLALPQGRIVRFYQSVQYEKSMVPIMLGTLALGLYLTIAAFSA